MLIMTFLKLHWIWWTISANWVSALLNGSMSAWREAKSKLRSDLLSHRAVIEKLCPAESNSKVNMEFYFYTYGVIAGDEVQQAFSSVNYIEVHWKDLDLRWDPKDYHGVHVINIPFDEMWHPHVIVTNSVDVDKLLVTPLNNRLLVRYDGDVLLHGPAFLKTTCSTNLTKYPFDHQDCEIIFIPFLDDCDIEVTRAGIMKMPDPFHLQGEWTIVYRNISISSYEGTNFHLPLIKVQLTIARSPLFYVVSVLAPMLLTSVMTSFVFCIPSSSGEKISFLVTVFVSNAVFLNFIAGTMPRSMTLDNMPRLTIFLIGVMLEGFLALLATLFVMRQYNIEQREDTKLTRASTVGSPKHTKVFTAECVKNDHSKANLALTGVDQKLIGFTLRSIRMFLERFKGKNSAKVEPKGDNFNTKNAKRECRLSCKITSREWDVIFFILFHVTSAPFYLLLFALNYI